MFSRILTVAALATLLLTGAAWATPATVQLRVEGSTSTILEGPVMTDGKTLDKGNGPHPCDGTTATPPQPPGPTMTSALDDASLAAGFTWDGTWYPFGDFLVTRIGPDASSGTIGSPYWGTVLNYQPTAVGGCQQQVRDGDELLFAFGDIYTQPLLRLSGSTKAAVGRPTTVTVVDGKNGSPMEGASVGGGVSDASGHATLAFDSAGVKRLKAEKAGAIRSNALEVCVSQTGAGDCGLPAVQQQTAVPATSKSARDTKAPRALISSPASGRHYRRGPRLLRGRATDDASGVSVVKLALRRHVRGHCRWWSGRRERFVGHNCHKIFFFAIGADANWSYLLPRSLPPGHYVLDVKAFDRVRNRDERFDRGRNRVVFDVIGRASRAASASRTRAGPRVHVMVVGKDGLLARAQAVRAPPLRVSASGRHCLVAGATPLAALAARLHHSSVSFHVRDFGHCSTKETASSGQLFVDRVAADRNSGQDGWFYKVDDRAGSAGAADPAGPSLRPGDRVLWFYCRFDTRLRSCQRSLRVAIGKDRAVAGAGVGVHVRSFDNDGHGRPEPGVTVALGEASAATDARGQAELKPQRAGSFLVEASKPGTTPSFPVPLVVLAAR